jgi:hypothetical protein
MAGSIYAQAHALVCRRDFYTGHLMVAQAGIENFFHKYSVHPGMLPNLSFDSHHRAAVAPLEY